MTSEVVAWMRLNAGRHLDDSRLSALVGELSVKNEDFRRLWASHDVRHHPYGHKQLRHPLVGELTLAFEGFPGPDNPELSVVIYHTEPGSPAAEALQLIASWSATASASSQHARHQLADNETRRT
jgi:hypothetical protein